MIEANIGDVDYINDMLDYRSLYINNFALL